MGLFDFFRKKAPASAGVVHRLVWFELQIAPSTYRFAIIPRQPILIGLPGENGGKGVVMLIRYDHAPAIFEKTVEQVDALVQKHRIRTLDCRHPGAAFAEQLMDKPGVHLRLSYADNTRWADVFQLDSMPGQITALIADTQMLARQVMAEMPHQPIAGEKALEHIEPDANAAHDKAPKTIVRVKITKTGAILANRQQVSLPALEALLDELKAQGGAVWYHREDPSENPSDSTDAVIKQVLDAIIARKLPIQLQEEEY